MPPRHPFMNVGLCFSAPWIIPLLMWHSLVGSMAIPLPSVPALKPKETIVV